MIILKSYNVNCGVKNYLKEDHRSYIRNFCSCKRKIEWIFVIHWNSSATMWSVCEVK